MNPRMILVVNDSRCVDPSLCIGALVVASERAVLEHGLKPLCELIAYASVGVDPTRMGIGPVPAINAALSRAGLLLSDVDLIDINEAFAPQVLACANELGAPEAFF